MTEWSKWLPTILIFLPVIGIWFLFLTSREQRSLHHLLGVLGVVPSLLLALYMYVTSLIQGTQWSHVHPWFSLPWLQVDFQYGVQTDGISLPFVLLTCVVTTIAAIASTSIRMRTKGYYILLLCLQIAMTGVFLASDLLLFFIFFDITLICTFFLIGIWGFSNKEKAANWFLLYNGLGSAFLLLAIIGLVAVFKTAHIPTLGQGIVDMMKHQSDLGPDFTYLMWGIFLSILFAFGIKLPIFPFHSWMLKVHVEAPIPVVMIHSGILLKMGAYGLIRFGTGLFPVYMKEISHVLAILGVVSILYGALVAWNQKEWKILLAYSSVSHMGLVVLGISAMSMIGLQGAVFQAISHGLISALLFYLIGLLYERTETTIFEELGGLSKSLPILSGMLLFGGLALLGLPGLSGFIGEFLSFQAAFNVYPVIAAIGTLSLIFTAVYTLRATMRTTFGELKEQVGEMVDLRMKERVPIMILAGLILLFGIYPAILSDPMQQSLYTLISRMGG